MGFKVTKDIEFANGISTDEIYVRIEDYKLEKASGVIRTFSNIYTSKETAQKAIPLHLEDLHLNDASGCLPPSMSVDSVQHIIESIKYFPVTESVDVTVTTYSSSFEEKSVEYVDFDSDGNEIISTRAESIETVTTGSAVVKKSIFQPNHITGSIFEYAYSKVKNHYAGIFGSDSITDVL
ncbi:MAG: hypothetical protein H8E16_19925 [Flavobacteriales bacterium]|nr:hypothetical protein [Flavobacteriales bacterium]